MGAIKHVLHSFLQRGVVKTKQIRNFSTFSGVYLGAFKGNLGNKISAQYFTHLSFVPLVVLFL